MSDGWDDYVVRDLDEAFIARRTLAVRRAAGNANASYFDVPGFIVGPFQKISRNKPIKILPIQDPDDARPAYVRHSPARLHRHDEIWELAKIGDPESREILGHECGHLDLHEGITPQDRLEQSFLGDREKIVPYVAKERSAEWQAHTYRDYLLVPDHIATALGDAETIRSACSVTLDLAKRRIDQLKRKWKRQSDCTTVSFCPGCGNISFERSDWAIRCSDCGWVPNS